MSVFTESRTVSDRAYLSEIVCHFAIKMCMPVMRSIAKENLEAIPKFVEVIGNELKEKYASVQNVEALIREVIAKARAYYALEHEYWHINRESVTEHQVDILEQNIITNAETELLQSFRWEVIQLSETEVPLFIRLTNPIHEVSCFEFALMRAGVEEAFKRPMVMRELPENLFNWGFRQVKMERSRPGDLVLFFSAMRPTHMGIRYKKGVLSKPGNRQRFAYVHAIDEAFQHYGKSVRVYRRNLLS